MQYFTFILTYTSTYRVRCGTSVTELMYNVMFYFTLAAYMCTLATIPGLRERVNASWIENWTLLMVTQFCMITNKQAWKFVPTFPLILSSESLWMDYGKMKIVDKHGCICLPLSVLIQWWSNFECPESFHQLNIWTNIIHVHIENIMTKPFLVLNY